MIPFIYVFLLLLTLYILYRAGQGLQNNDCKILSHSGIIALIVYSLNEGLRFGRGIDYSYYWEEYDSLVYGAVKDTNIGYLWFETFFVQLGFSWQECLIVISFIFILATLFLMKCYKESLPYALPLFVLFSNAAVENMIRWYIALSFVFIGLSYQLRGTSVLNRKFFVFVLIACTFHYAIIPLPVVFFIISKLKKPLLHPFIIIPLFYIVAFSFETDVMMNFANFANSLSMMSEKFENYGNDLEFWLTGGFDGVETTPLPATSEQLFLIAILWLGYKTVKSAGRSYIFAYNLFIIGYLIYPIARQIELLERFDQPLLFFRAIVLASILLLVFKDKRVYFKPIFKILMILLLINIGRITLTLPFNMNSQCYLYVWDWDRQTPSSVLQMWNDTRIDNSKKNADRNRKIKQL